MQTYEWSFWLKRSESNIGKRHLPCSCPCKIPLWMIQLPFGTHPGCTKLTGNINLIWKIIIGEKIVKLKLVWFSFNFTLRLSQDTSNKPWFINRSAIRWSRRRVAPESLPQFFYQAELKINNHIQYCLRK